MSAVQSYEYEATLKESASVALFWLSSVIHGGVNVDLEVIIDTCKRELHEDKMLRSLKVDERKALSHLMSTAKTFKAYVSNKLIALIQAEPVRQEETTYLIPGDTMTYCRVHFTFTDKTSVSLDFCLEPNEDIEDEAYRDWRCSSVTWKDGGQDFTLAVGFSHIKQHS